MIFVHNVKWIMHINLLYYVVIDHAALICGLEWRRVGNHWDDFADLSPSKGERWKQTWEGVRTIVWAKQHH